MNDPVMVSFQCDRRLGDNLLLVARAQGLSRSAYLRQLAEVGVVYGMQQAEGEQQEEAEQGDGAE